MNCIYGISYLDEKFLCGKVPLVFCRSKMAILCAVYLIVEYLSSIKLTYGKSNKFIYLRSQMSTGMLVTLD